MINLKRRLTIICLLLLILYVPSASALPANFTARENPANVTAASGQVDFKTLAVMADMYIRLQNISIDLNQSNLIAANLDYQSFRALYENNRDIIGHLFDSDADARAALNSTDLTVDDIRAYLKAAGDYNETYLAYQNYIASGDRVNATASGLDLQAEYGRLSTAYNTLRASSYASMDRLDDSNQDSINASLLQPFLDASGQLMSQIAIKHRMASSNFSVTLSSETKQAHIGDTVIYVAMLKSNSGTPIQGATVGLCIDNVPVSSGVTDVSGECQIIYTIPDSMGQDSVSVNAEYTPPGLQEYPAYSNTLSLEIMDEASGLSLHLSPGQASYGAVVNLNGTLTSSRGFPESDRIINIYLNGTRIGSATTGIGGLYDYSLPIAEWMPGGSCIMTARYEQASGSDLMSSSSPDATLNIVSQRTLIALILPGENFTVGDTATFEGNLITENGLNVAGANVLAYLDDSRIGAGTTDTSGHYMIQAMIPYDSAQGNHSLQVVYVPAGGSLYGSSSDPYAIRVNTVRPVLATGGTPLVLFSNDTLNVNGSLRTDSGVPVRGLPVMVRVSDSIGGTVVTGEDGNFNFSRTVNGYDPAGLYDISVSLGPAGTASTTVGHVLIVPVNKAVAITALAAILILIFIVILLVNSGMTLDRLARLATGRSRLEPDIGEVDPELSQPDKPAIKPAAIASPRIPAEISELIQAGRFMEAAVAMYVTARAIATSTGEKVPDSDTHREFYRSVIASHPSIADALRSIVDTYERMRYGHKDASPRDMETALGNLKTVQSALNAKDGERKI